MKISFAICTHNEGHYIDTLLTKVTEFIKLDGPSGIEYEIVVVDDNSTDQLTLDTLDKFKDHIILFQHSLNGDFASHKNFMNSCCSGDWILNLDADEFVSDDFMGYMSLIIESNPDIEAYWVPRVNTVEGLTLKHLQKWGWVITKMEEYRKLKFMYDFSEEYKLLSNFGHIISEEPEPLDPPGMEAMTPGRAIAVTYYEPIVAWPDFQMRLYKNSDNIKWVSKVHEKLVGFTKYGMLPHEPVLAIQHFKDITRQESQNDFYETIK